jgi:Uma2 family endonuclease
MATVTKIGPGDHGRAMTLEEYEQGDYEQGYKYEIIDGKLYVSPEPNAPEGIVEDWLGQKLQEYRKDHPDVINFVHLKTRVFVHSRERATVPEPDIAAYRNFPLRRRWRDIRWEEVSPILIVEILTGDDPSKDLVRNAELYFEVPTVKEYWVVDAREEPEEPSMRVHRRHGQRWRIIDLAFGGVYTTRLLPGFELVIDPRT